MVTTVLDQVVGVDEHGQGVGRRHLLLQLVGPDLDPERLRLGSGGVGERLDRLDDPGRLERPPDVGGGVALLHLEHDLALPGAGVVLGAGEPVLDQRNALPHAERGDQRHDQQDDRHGDAAHPGAFAATASSGVVLLHHRLLGVHEGLLGVRLPGVRLPDRGLRRGAGMLATGGLLRVVLSHPRPRRSLLAPYPSRARCPMPAAGSARQRPGRPPPCVSCPCDPGRGASTPRTPWSDVHHTA